MSLGKPIIKLISKENRLEIKKHEVLEVCIGSRVMLKRNLDTNLGLVYGSCGTTLDLYYCGKPEPDLPLS